MTSFLFWNINGRQRPHALARLVERHDVDVLILAECNIPPGVILYALDTARAKRFRRSKSMCPRIEVYTKLPPRALATVHDDHHMTIRHLHPGRSSSILLAAVHLPSRLYQSADSQTAFCSIAARDIRDTEERVGHSRTILVGDLNMNPFDPGVVGGAGFHAVVDRRIAQRGSRTIARRAYPFFYNPMWNKLGDEGPSPPGSFYRTSGEFVTYFWHMYDQVLVRPALLERFSNRHLRIPTGVGRMSFVSEHGVPNPIVASDHLPLVFRIDD